MIPIIGNISKRGSPLCNSNAPSALLTILLTLIRLQILPCNFNSFKISSALIPTFGPKLNPTT